MTENGQGIDLNGLNYITIQFSNEQIIDSLVVLSDSNVESYYISYTDSNGNAHVINDVIFLIFLIYLIIYFILIFRTKIIRKQNLIK